MTVTEHGRLDTRSRSLWARAKRLRYAGFPPMLGTHTLGGRNAPTTHRVVHNWPDSRQAQYTCRSVKSPVTMTVTETNTIRHNARI